jgi:integrase
MSLFRRPDSPYWYTEFVHKGRRIVRSTGTTSAREAAAFERRLREEVAREAPALTAPTPSLTIDQACGRYWTQHGRKLADASNVQRWLLYAVRYLDRDLPLHELSNKHVTAFVAAMEAAGIGPISINRTVTTLQGVHNRAAKSWEVTVKVIDWKGAKTKEIPRTRWLPREEAQHLLAALPIHIRRVVLFLLTVGLRRGEAFRLRWVDVDLENASIVVRIKGGQTRMVQLSPEAAMVLHESPRDGVLVFDATNFRKHFEAARRAAGIEDFRWHDLRHTFATWLGQSGAPLEVIRDQLCHSNIAVTQRYRHVAQPEVRAALQKLPTLSPNTTNVMPLKVG